jgi:hypothetical protein
MRTPMPVIDGRIAVSLTVESLTVESPAGERPAVDAASAIGTAPPSGETSLSPGSTRRASSWASAQC